MNREYEALVADRDSWARVIARMVANGDAPHESSLATFLAADAAVDAYVFS